MRVQIIDISTEEWGMVFLEPWASGEDIGRLRVLAEIAASETGGFRKLISVGQLANSNAI